MSSRGRGEGRQERDDQEIRRLSEVAEVQFVRLCSSPAKQTNASRPTRREPQTRFNTITTESSCNGGLGDLRSLHIQELFESANIVDGTNWPIEGEIAYSSDSFDNISRKVRDSRDTSPCYDNLNDSCRLCLTYRPLQTANQCRSVRGNLKQY